jgi:threonine/homoserine/homoserine lactone efflux protein
VPQEPLLFLGIAALLTITPGADMALVGRSVLVGGRRDAFATTLGILTGCMVWAIVSAVRLAGAAYLVWLGVQSLLAGWRGEKGEGQTLPPGGGAAVAERRRRARIAFRQGLLTNLFNPKIAIFYSTFLPQFIAPGDPALLLSLVLAGVHIGLGLVWLTAYAWLLDRAVNAFRSSRVRRALDALTGAVLVALGLRLAAERP